MRVRQVAHEVPRVAGAREPLGRPREVLRDHVQAAEHEEGAAGHEVLCELAVVPAELFVGLYGSVRIGGARPGRRPQTAAIDDREECRIADELQRREVLDVHPEPP